MGAVLKFAKNQNLRLGRLRFSNFCLHFFYTRQNMEIVCQKLFILQLGVIDLYYEKLRTKIKKLKRPRRRVFSSEAFKTNLNILGKKLRPARLSYDDFFAIFFCFLVFLGHK